MNYDSPAFYSEQELKDMLKKFEDVPADVITLPDVPFSYPMIARELLRRERDVCQECGGGWLHKEGCSHEGDFWS